MRSSLLQDWIVVQNDASKVTSFTQPQPGWMDVSSFADATFWIDFAQVQTPTGGLNVQLILETSPTLDESYFAAAAPPINNPPVTSGGPKPIGIRTAASQSSTVPLARYLRWRLNLRTGDGGGSGSWGMTFRIRVSPSVESYFTPVQISGCGLWLRADLGLTYAFNTASSVQTWVDQSGAGHDFNQFTSTNQPGGPGGSNLVNGVAAIRFASAAPSYMTATAVALVPQPFETYVVMKASTVSSTPVVFDTVSGSEVALKSPSTTSLNPYAGTTGFAPTVTDVTAAAAIYRITWSTSTSSVYQNGTLKGTGNPGSNAGLPTILGAIQGAASGFLDALLAEFIVFGRTLTTVEDRRLTRYLGGRYGISVP